MSVGSSDRAKAAKKKVSELVAKGHRLAEGAGSQHYREQVEQPKRVGPKGTGAAAEEVAARLKRGG